MPGIDVTPEPSTVSQSWLNTAMTCPEQARLEMHGELPRKESDATAIGTSLHTGIETVLRGGTLDDGEAAAIECFDGLTALDEFVWIQIKTRDTAIKTLQRVFWTWASEVYPQLPGPRAIEMPFDVALCVVGGVPVHLKGAIDYVDELGDIWDWKSAASFRNWSEWEIPKKLQPTAYTYGLMMTDNNSVDDEYTFHYAVMSKAKQEHIVFTTTRSLSDWSWLQHQTRNLAELITAGLSAWPTNDQSALCSPKWCGAWDQCKGAHSA